MYESEESPGRKLALRANPTYWNGKPEIERVQFVSRDSETQVVEELVRGELDLIRDFPESLVRRIEQSRSCRVMTSDGLGVSFLGFNLAGDDKSNPFRNIKIREALSIGIDTPTLVNEALAGRGTIARQLVTPYVFGFDPGYVAETRDVLKARQLIRSSLPPDFQTEIFGNDGIRLNSLAQQMKKLGLNVQPRLVEWSEFYEKLINHQIPLYTLSWNCSTGDASDFLDSCLHSPDPASGYGNFNVAGYRNPEVDRLIEMSGQTLKMNERKEYLHQALDLASRDIPYIPLYSRYRHYGVNDSLAWQPRRDGRLYAIDMHWKQAR
jgi:peptide/nickel transport system substrate-binding protein